MLAGCSSGWSPGNTTTVEVSSTSSSGKAVSPTMTASPVPRWTGWPHKQDVGGVGALVLHLLGDALSAVAGHHDGPHDLQVGESLEDVHDHRPAAQQMQRLGA